jgi:hypothetical protein
MAHPAMAGPADPGHEAQAEDFVLRLLGEAPEPVNPDAILEEGRRRQDPLSYSVLRTVIWSLVGRGVVQVTNDWRLKLAR